MIRPLRAARRSAVKARTQAFNQMRDLLVTAPEGMRARLRGLRAHRLAKTAARFRPGPRPADPEAALKFAMRSIARRHLALSQEIASLESELGRIVAGVAPGLVAAKGIGTETAAVLLMAAGDNPERLRSEAAFAHLCGVAPIPASSGNTVRHRLNRRGNREANWALYMIVVGRLRTDERTRRYAAKRTAEGKTKAEIIRCLKRYVAREVYRALVAPSAPAALAALGDGEPEAQGHEDAAGEPPQGPGEGRTAPEPLSQGPRAQCDDSHDHQAYEGEGGPEGEHLQAGGTRRGVDELRQEGQEEQGHLRVQDVREDALAEDDRELRPLGLPRQDEALSVQDGLHAQVDEVSGARVLHHRERHGASGEDRREADRSEGRVHQDARAHPGRRDEPRGPTLRDAAGEDVDHVRPRHHDEGQ